MCRCRLCGTVMGHEAEYSVSFGKFDCELQICRWCKQDLSLFGIRFNQVIGLMQKAFHAVIMEVSS